MTTKIKEKKEINEFTELKNEIDTLKRMIENVTRISVNQPKNLSYEKEMSVLINLRTSVTQNNDLILSFIKQQTEITDDLKKETSATNKENNQQVQALRTEIQELYKAVLNLSADSKDAINEIYHRVDEAKAIIDDFMNSHCSDAEREHVKSMIEERKKKIKDKEETGKLIKSKLIDKIIDWKTLAILIGIIYFIFSQINNIEKILRFFKIIP